MILFTYEGEIYIMLDNRHYRKYKDFTDKINDSQLVKLAKTIKESIPFI